MQWESAERMQDRVPHDYRDIGGRTNQETESRTRRSSLHGRIYGVSSIRSAGSLGPIEWPGFLLSYLGLRIPIVKY